MKTSILLPIVFLTLSSPVGLAYGNNSNADASKMTKNGSENVRMDAIEIIMEDHAYIRQKIALLDKNLDSDTKKSRSIFKDLKDFIIQHETMEQKVWYPEIEKNNDLKSIIVDLKKEEKDAGDEIKKLDKIKEDEEWAAKVRNFLKAVEHHAKEEETKLFPKVRNTVDKSTLQAIGDKLEKYKKQNKMQ